MFIVDAIAAAERANGHTRTSSISPFHVSPPGTVRSPLPMRKTSLLFSIGPVPVPCTTCAPLTKMRSVLPSYVPATCVHVDSAPAV
jgi:hypothetical protein